MKQNIISYLILLALFAMATMACNNNSQNKTTRHYSEAILQGFKERAKKDDRTIPLQLLDSFYNTFPYVSAADEYGYYNFKRELFVFIRYNELGFDTAILYVDSMIAVIENEHLQKEMKQEYINAFNIRSDYLRTRLRYSEAISDLNRCRELNREIGDSCLLAENTRTLSLIALKQTDFQLAISLYKEAIALAATCKKDFGQFVRMQRYLDDLGFYYSTVTKYDSALLYHFEAEKYVLENSKRYDTTQTFTASALENIYGNIAVTLKNQQKYTDAQNYLYKAMAYSEQGTKGMIDLKTDLADILRIRGKLYEADTVSLAAMQNITKADLVAKTRLLKVRAEISAAQKNYKQQAMYQNWMMQIKDSIANNKIALLKTNPFLQYEQLDKKYQVELLKKDNQNQKNKTSAVITIGILIALLASLLLYFLWRLRKLMARRVLLYKTLKETMAEKEIAEKMLKEKELVSQEIRLQMEFNDAIVQQRAQISDDMHDELCSSLAALKFYVEDMRMKATGEPEKHSYSTITNEVTGIYNNARNYMHNLKHDHRDSTFSLTGFLKEIQQKFTEKGLMQVDLNIDNDAISKLTTTQHYELYHIVKECLSNVIKHADATRLSIDILVNSTSCEFYITDNGMGYDKGTITYGIGLNSILKRIQNLDGHVDIESGASGTTVKGYFML